MKSDGPVFPDQVALNQGQWFSSETITYAKSVYEAIPSRSSVSIRWSRYTRSKGHAVSKTKRYQESK